MNDCVRDRAVLHHAPVDEDVLRPADRALPRAGQRGHEAGDPETGRCLPDLDQVAAVLVELEQPVAQAGRRRALQQTAWATRQGEPDTRMPQGQLGDESRHLGRLGTVRF